MPVIAQTGTTLSLNKYLFFHKENKDTKKIGATPQTIVYIPVEAHVTKSSDRYEASKKILFRLLKLSPNSPSSNAIRHSTSMIGTRALML